MGRSTRRSNTSAASPTPRQSRPACSIRGKRPGPSPIGPKIELGRSYRPSNDVVVREIEGEIVIVPLTSGIGDIEDELLSLNETGRAIWERLDGSRPLAEVVAELEAEYEGGEGLVQSDVVGFLQELFDRRMIVEKG
jgi:hypothetical protein